VLPGFVDCHLHYPQAGVIASYGRQLLDWLNDYVFPAEARFADASEAERTAAFVVDRLLAHGTTTASVFATVHPIRWTPSSPPPKPAACACCAARC
jgi:guanine deaminase